MIVLIVRVDIVNVDNVYYKGKDSSMTCRVLLRLLGLVLEMEVAWPAM